MSCFACLSIDVNLYDALRLHSQSTSQLNDLSNTPIHPIFRIENFLTSSVEDLTSSYQSQNTNLSASQNLGRAELECLFKNRIGFVHIDQATYARLTPALRLASRFLQLSVPFLHHLYHSKPVLRTSSRIPSRRAYVLHPLGDDKHLPAEKKRSTFEHDLRTKLADKILFFQTDSLPAAVFMRTNRAHTLLPRGPIRIQIQKSFLDPILNDNIWNQQDPNVQKITQLEIAIILTHEIAHAIWRLSHASLNINVSEPFVDMANFEDQLEPEVGHALDGWIGGGGPIQRSYGCGLRTLRWYWRTTRFDSKQLRRARFPDKFVIKSESLLQLFDDGTWIQHFNGTKPISLVLTPIRSFLDIICAGKLDPRRDEPAFETMLESFMHHTSPV